MLRLESAATLVDEQQQAGSKTIQFDGRDVSKNRG